MAALTPYSIRRRLYQNVDREQRAKRPEFIMQGEVRYNHHEFDGRYITADGKETLPFPLVKKLLAGEVVAGYTTSPEFVPPPATPPQPSNWDALHSICPEEDVD